MRKFQPGALLSHLLNPGGNFAPARKLHVMQIVLNGEWRNSKRTLGLKVEALGALAPKKRLLTEPGREEANFEDESYKQESDWSSKEVSLTDVSVKGSYIIR